MALYGNSGYPRFRTCNPGRTRVLPALLLFLGAAAFAEPGPGGDGASADTLAPVTVEATTVGGATATTAVLSAAPLERTPIAVDVISASDLLDRGAISLSEAVRGLPSVGDNYNTFGYVESLQVRGFTLNELLNYQRDGLTVSSHVPVALEDKERIEIVKGVSGMLAGVSAPGGLVNYVLKQPTAQDLAQFNAMVSERGSLLLHTDLGGRAGDQGQFGYRVNLAAEERRPQIDNAWSKRALASAFLDWRVSAASTLQLELEHQKVREISVPAFSLVDATGSGTGNTLPPPIDPRINLNAQPWTQPFESTATTGSLRWLQRLGSDWDLAVRVGQQRSVTNDRIAFPDGCSSAAVYVYNGLCANADVDIYQYISDGERRDTTDADARLHGAVRTGGVEHELSAGVRAVRYAERYPPFQAYNYAGTINVFAPVALPAAPAATTANAPLDTHLTELYFFDVARGPGGWSAWVGARATRIAQDSSLTDGSEATRFTQHAVTPWAGLGLEPWEGGFAYVSAGSGIEVQSVPNHPAYVYTGQVVNFANPGQVLPVSRSRQVELGFKQRAGNAWSLDAALFRIVKPFADNVPLPNGTALQVMGAREERHQGVEVSVRARPGAELALEGAFTLLDARTISAVDAAWVGKPATNVAPVSATLAATWTPAALEGFAWRNEAIVDGHKTALPDGSVALPSYWQWDTAASYHWRARGWVWTARAGVDNVTNRSYWREAPMASWGSIYLFPAAARTARVGVSVNL